MISLNELDRILGWMQGANLELLSVRDGDAQLTLRRGGRAQSASEATINVVTKGIGTFMPAHPRRPDAALEPGDRVAAGAVVGYLRAGQTLTPIVTGRGGKVSAILATPGGLLGYGARVLSLIPEA